MGAKLFSINDRMALVVGEGACSIVYVVKLRLFKEGMLVVDGRHHAYVIPYSDIPAYI